MRNTRFVRKGKGDALKETWEEKEERKKKRKQDFSLFIALKTLEFDDQNVDNLSS